MAQYDPLERLQQVLNSSDSRSTLPNAETTRESNIHTKFSRPVGPGPRQARRGGVGQSLDRKWHSSFPKRAIYYDIAESFMDHSTNPLSSDLYKIRFRHSAKQWPNGRFALYKEKLDKSDGNIINITCTRTIPIVPKRKRKIENTEAILDKTPLIVSIDPNAQEQKKKLADKQMNLYADFYGSGKVPKLLSTNQIKKTNSITSTTKSSALDSSTGENKEVQNS